MTADVTREPTGGQELRDALIAMLRSLHRDHSGHVNSTDEADAILALPEVAALLADVERVRRVEDAGRRLSHDDCPVPTHTPKDVARVILRALDGEPQP